MDRRGFLRAGAGTALGLTGCPTATTPNGQPGRPGTIGVLEQLEGEFVLVRDARFGPYDKVSIPSVTASPDGKHSAWAAAVDDAWSLYIDGKKSDQAWGSIAEVAWRDPTTVVYQVERSGLWYVFDGGKLGPSFDELVKDSLVTPPKGAGVAYIGKGPDGLVVVERGNEHDPVKAASKLVMDDFGKHAAWTTQHEDGWRVHFDAAEYGPFQEVGALVVSSRGGRFAAAVFTGGGWRALVDGKPSEPYEKLGGLAFSEDGAELAMVVSADGKLGVMKDRVMLPGRYWQIENLGYAARAPVLGFAAKDARDVAVAVDGREAGRYDRVMDVVVAPSGKGWAAAVEKTGEQMVVTHTSKHPFDVVVPGTLCVDAVTERWGAITGKLGGPLWIVIEGERVSKIELEGVGAARLRGWVRAELIRARP